MKNKSKLKKIREKKAGTATVTKEWLYMNPNSITVAEIENALDGMDGIETEIWKEAGVLEVEVPEHHSMDIEEIAVNLKDEYANAYLKEHDIHALLLSQLTQKIMHLCKESCKNYRRSRRVLLWRYRRFYSGSKRARSEIKCKR